MLELIYSPDSNTLIGGAETLDETLHLPVVESSGNVVGRAGLNVCHARRLVHPYLRMYVINRGGELLLRKRDPEEKEGEAVWDCPVYGHVLFGECFEETIFRRAALQLGPVDLNPQYFGTYMYTVPTEKMLVGVYAAIGSLTPSRTSEEAGKYAYRSLEELGSGLGSGRLAPELEYDLKLFETKLTALL